MVNNACNPPTDHCGATVSLLPTTKYPPLLPFSLLLNVHFEILLTLYSYVADGALNQQYQLNVSNVDERIVASAGIIIYSYVFCFFFFLIVPDIILQLTPGTIITSMSGGLNVTSIPIHYTCPTHDIKHGAASIDCTYPNCIFSMNRKFEKSKISNFQFSRNLRKFRTSPTIIIYFLTLETFTIRTPGGNESQLYVIASLDKPLCTTW